MPDLEPVRVFISYKKDDEPGDRRGREFVDELASVIRGRTTTSAVPVEVWYDRELEAGSSWSADIEQHLGAADVYVLAYTPRFFTEDGYIAQHELPTILERLDTAKTIPVIRHGVTLPDGIPEAFARLRALQASSEGRFVDDMQSAERAAAIDRLADEVHRAATEHLAGRLTTRARPLTERLAGSVQQIHRDYLGGLGAAPEDQLKYPVLRLLEDLRPSVAKRELTFHTEDSRPNATVTGVRLDIAAIDPAGYRVGHIELKSTAKGANPTTVPGTSGWTQHDRQQWKLLTGLPNLIYTNGSEWTLLRSGVVIDSARIGGERILPDAELKRFIGLVTDFLTWSPRPPRTARGLARRLAPLSRLLRDAVKSEIATSLGEGKLNRMLGTWRVALMPDATADEFADSVAQTFTYGLLLARVEDRVTLPLQPGALANALRAHGHRLLGSVFDLLTSEDVRKRLREPIGLLESAIASIDPTRFGSRQDTWLYFYEDFLAEYDPALRKNAGVYYTPVEVVTAQVRMIDHVLRTRFGRDLGFADPGVAVLDPAVGTGTYLLAVAERAMEHARLAGHSLDDTRRQLLGRLYGFEILIGAYSVAHLRLSQLLRGPEQDTNTDGSGAHVYLSDTLSAPLPEHGRMDAPPIFVSDVMDDITEESRRASVVKGAGTDVTVVLGNPPYDRSKRNSDATNVVLHGGAGIPRLIDDFRQPVVDAGRGVTLKHNLDDPYVHFIRWAVWKAAEQSPKPGIVSFITNSSYLRSEPFLGVRKHLREQFDELWIIDLGGDNRGARPEPNVFNIQTAVAIFVAIQRPTRDDGVRITPSMRRRSPATVRYRRLTGTRDEKLSALSDLDRLVPSDASWAEVIGPDRWSGRFVPQEDTARSSWPDLRDLFPWQHSGAQFTRTWPIAPDEDTLRERWRALTRTGAAAPDLFKESRGRRVTTGWIGGVSGRPRPGTDLVTGRTLPALGSPSTDGVAPQPVRYGYRSFDRMWCLPDTRIGDYLREPLWRAAGDSQIYFASMFGSPLGRGPALTATAFVPDLHHFSGRGTKDVIPMWRDPAGQDANVNKAAVETLSATYGRRVAPEDLFAYVFGLLGTGAYTEKYAAELQESSVRIPLTANGELFDEVARFGQDLLSVATFGERAGRMNEFGQRVRPATAGRASFVRPVPSDEYPSRFLYDPQNEELALGAGLIAGVRKEVWEFRVSNLQVVKSWLDYRRRDRKGKKTSPLDRIEPRVWTFSSELIDLLHTLEFFVEQQDAASELIQRLVDGPLLDQQDVPKPLPEERRAPAAAVDTETIDGL